MPKQKTDVVKKARRGRRAAARIKVILPAGADVQTRLDAVMTEFVHTAPKKVVDKFFADAAFVHAVLSRKNQGGRPPRKGRKG